MQWTNDTGKMPFALVASLMLTVPVHAQCSPHAAVNDPPKILRLMEDAIRPGKRHEHTAAVANQIAKDSGSRVMMRLEALSGNERFVTINYYDSLASMVRAKECEAKATQQYDELARDLVATRSITILKYRPDLSYRPSVTSENTKFMSVRYLAILPDKERDFETGFRLYNAARAEKKSEDSFAMYEVLAGASAQILVQFRPADNEDRWDQKFPNARETMNPEDFAQFVATVPPSIASYKDELFVVVTNGMRENPLRDGGQ